MQERREPIAQLSLYPSTINAPIFTQSNLLGAQLPLPLWVLIIKVSDDIIWTLQHPRASYMEMPGRALAVTPRQVEQIWLPLTFAP